MHQYLQGKFTAVPAYASLRCTPRPCHRFQGQAIIPTKDRSATTISCVSSKTAAATVRSCLYQNRGDNYALSLMNVLILNAFLVFSTLFQMSKSYESVMNDNLELLL